MLPRLLPTDDGILNMSAGEICDDGKNSGVRGSCQADCGGFAQPASGLRVLLAESLGLRRTLGPRARFQDLP